jgi:hypothetical protein
MNSDKDPPKQAHDKRREDEKLDQAIDDSFPASDPLPISPTTTGAPRKTETSEGAGRKDSKNRNG